MCVNFFTLKWNEKSTAHNRKSMIFSMTSHANDVSYGHNRFMSCLRQVMECVVKMYIQWIDLFISSCLNDKMFISCVIVLGARINKWQWQTIKRFKSMQNFPAINKSQNSKCGFVIQHQQHTKKRHNLFANPTKIYIYIFQHKIYVCQAYYVNVFAFSHESILLWTARCIFGVDN